MPNNTELDVVDIRSFTFFITPFDRLNIDSIIRKLVSVITAKSSIREHLDHYDKKPLDISSEVPTRGF